jgi:hypothetical protein
LKIKACAGGDKKSPRNIVDFDLVGGPDGTNPLALLYFILLSNALFSILYKISQSIFVHKKAY